LRFECGGPPLTSRGLAYGLSANTLQAFPSRPHKNFSSQRTGAPHQVAYGREMGRGSRRNNLKVFIVDDSGIVVERLAELLKDIPGAKLVGSAGNAVESADSILRLNPDVIILDLQMPGGSGFEVLKKVKKVRPLVKVIVLTNFPFPVYRDRCLEGGADFFLDKSAYFDKFRASSRIWRLYLLIKNEAPPLMLRSDGRAECQRTTVGSSTRPTSTTAAEQPGKQTQPPTRAAGFSSEPSRLPSVCSAGGR
jgi:DNA-binding NarL/FixJ family response regulator